MKRLLIVFVNSFPFNISEPFLENEIPLYKDYFDRVLMVTACKKGEQPTRNIQDENIELLKDYTLARDPGSVLGALPCMLMDGMFYRELWHLIRYEGFSVKKLNELVARSLCANHRAMQTAKWLKRHPEYRVEALYSYWMHIPAYAALRLKTITKQRYYAVTRVHGYDLYAERSETKYQPFHRQMYEKLEAVAAICEQGKAYLEEQYGKVGKVAIHRLGAFDRGCHNPSAERHPFRVVSCSRTIPLKRLDRLVDALSAITDVPIHWTHIGGGPMQKKLEEYARIRLPQNVATTFTGTVPNAAVYELYREQPFHVFVNVSETEGVPVAIMEAMSFDIPVIATAVGGTAELIEEGINGCLLPADFADEELVSRIRDMMRLSEDDYAQMRMEARRKYEQEYSAIPNYRRFLECLSNRNMLD